MDGQLAGSPSQLFDAIAIILEEDQARSLLHEGAAVQWVSDAYGHLKMIGYDADGQLLIAKAGAARRRFRNRRCQAILGQRSDGPHSRLRQLMTALVGKNVSNLSRHRQAIADRDHANLHAEVGHELGIDGADGLGVSVRLGRIGNVAAPQHVVDQDKAAAAQQSE